MDPLAAEQEKVANLRRETITPAMVMSKAQNTELANDRIMRLGEERLNIRMKLAQIARLTFWKEEIAIPPGTRPYRHVMKIAWKSFPYLQRVVYRRKGAKLADLAKELRATNKNIGQRSVVSPVKNVTEARKEIGCYLKRVTGTAKHIVEFMYDTRDNPKKRTPARQRTWEVPDILDTFHLLRVVDGADEENEVTGQPSHLAAISAFVKTEEHYTYTLDNDGDDEDIEPDGDNEVGEGEEFEGSNRGNDSVEDMQSMGDDGRHFTAIT